MKFDLRKILSISVKVLLPLALTILLLVYLFRKVNFGEMMEIISHGVDYWWILCAMILSIFSHIIRAARWRLQLNAMDIKPPFMALCCSVFGCYALNLIFPRLGEIWRCTYIAKRQKASFSKVFGSMVADRLADTLMVGALLLLTFLLAAKALQAFLIKYPVGRDLIELFSSVWFWIAGAGVILIMVLIYRIWRNTRFIIKVRDTILHLWEGFAAVGKMKGKWKFIFFTILLWICYFIQLYVAFFAFSFTRRLCEEPGLAFGLLPCLVAFVFSSIGMAVPSNGGLGPWNIAIMFGLAIYGVSDAEGTAFSMLQWTGQTVMLVILGIYTMGYIIFSKSQSKNYV